MSITVEPMPPGPGATSPDSRLRKRQVLHDLRQSLTAVMSLTAIVDKSIDRGPEMLKRLHQIRSEADWMIRLVSSAGPRASDVEVLDVGDVVAEAWSAAVSTGDRSVRFVRDAWACAAVDRDNLNRSVRNLLDNALRAAGDRGRVVVEVRVEGDAVAVAVSDDGPGFGNVAPQQGLGLLTVRRFAAEHGGRLDVRHPASGGAEVTLRLPRLSPTTCVRTGEARCGS